MAVEKKPVTVDEFEKFATLPENADHILELIGGEIVEVSSNPYSSKISMRMGRFVGVFVDDHDLGHVTGEAGGYWVSGERYAPDVAFISKERQPELVHEGYNPNPPNLVIEVISPSDDERKFRIKLANYLAAGVLVWVVYPQSREIEIYAPGQPMKLLDIKGILDGGDVLPGFQLAVRDIFPD